jgi:hypothetical protein
MWYQVGRHPDALAGLAWLALHRSSSSGGGGGDRDDDDDDDDDGSEALTALLMLRPQRPRLVPAVAMLGARLLAQGRPTAAEQVLQGQGGRGLIC